MIVDVDVDVDVDVVFVCGSEELSGLDVAVGRVKLTDVTKGVVIVVICVGVSDVMFLRSDKK